MSKEEWVEVTPERYDKVTEESKLPVINLFNHADFIWLGGGLPRFMITYKKSTVTDEMIVDKIYERME